MLCIDKLICNDYRCICTGLTGVTLWLQICVRKVPDPNLGYWLGFPWLSSISSEEFRDNNFKQATTTCIALYQISSHLRPHSRVTETTSFSNLRINHFTYFQLLCFREDWTFIRTANFCFWHHRHLKHAKIRISSDRGVHRKIICKLSVSEARVSSKWSNVRTSGHVLSLLKSTGIRTTLYSPYDLKVIATIPPDTTTSIITMMITIIKPSYASTTLLILPPLPHSHPHCYTHQWGQNSKLNLPFKNML